MKIFQLIVGLLLFAVSAVALWFAIQLKDQRMELMAHQEVLSGSLEDMATHAGLELPPLRPGFDRDPLRQMIVQYKNQAAELTYNQQETRKYREVAEDAAANEAGLRKQANEAQLDANKIKKALAIQVEKTAKFEKERNAALRHVKEVEKSTSDLQRQIARLQNELNEAKSKMAAMDDAPAAPAAIPPSTMSAPSTAIGAAVSDPISILSINQDWGFIIVDAGRDRGIKVGQEASFSGKDGRLITVKITKVEPTLAIVDIPDARIQQAAKGMQVRVR